MAQSTFSYRKSSAQDHVKFQIKLPEYMMHLEQIDALNTEIESLHAKQKEFAQMERELQTQLRDTGCQIQCVMCKGSGMVGKLSNNRGFGLMNDPCAMCGEQIDMEAKRTLYGVKVKSARLISEEKTKNERDIRELEDRKRAREDHFANKIRMTPQLQLNAIENPWSDSADLARYNALGLQVNEYAQVKVQIKLPGFRCDQQERNMKEAETQRDVTLHYSAAGCKIDVNPADIESVMHGTGVLIKDVDFDKAETLEIGIEIQEPLNLKGVEPSYENGTIKILFPKRIMGKWTQASAQRSEIAAKSFTENISPPQTAEETSKTKTTMRGGNALEGGTAASESSTWPDRRGTYSAPPLGTPTHSPLAPQVSRRCSSSSQASRRNGSISSPSRKISSASQASRSNSSSSFPSRTISSRSVSSPQRTREISMRECEYCKGTGKVGILSHHHGRRWWNSDCKCCGGTGKKMCGAEAGSTTGPRSVATFSASPEPIPTPDTSAQPLGRASTCPQASRTCQRTPCEKCKGRGQVGQFSHHRGWDLWNKQCTLCGGTGFTGTTDAANSGTGPSPPGPDATPRRDTQERTTVDDVAIMKSEGKCLPAKIEEEANCAEEEVSMAVDEFPLDCLSSLSERPYAGYRVIETHDKRVLVEIDLPGYSQERMKNDLVSGGSDNPVLRIAPYELGVAITVCPRHAVCPGCAYTKELDKYQEELSLLATFTPKDSIIKIDKHVTLSSSNCLSGSVVLTFDVDNSPTRTQLGVVDSGTDYGCGRVTNGGGLKAFVGTMRSNGTARSHSDFEGEGSGSNGLANASGDTVRRLSYYKEM